MDINGSVDSLLPRLALAALASVGLSLAACGGGGVQPDPPSGLAALTGNNSLAVRPLPAIYRATTTKAINYSPYRTALGPAQGEMTATSDIQYDLGLLSSAGFNLIRLFDTDPEHEQVLAVAAQNYPNLKFQLGINLVGIAPASQASCSNATNESDVLNGIRLANTYSNVASISVGNETSLFQGYMPVSCLLKYVLAVKKNVLQPVTADDDYTFYAGLSNQGVSPEPEVPDNILPFLDFVSMHTYPMTNQGQWTAGNLGSAAALMAAAAGSATTGEAQYTYAQVRSYIYARGAPAGLPITVGESGWKWRPTNPVLAFSNNVNCGAVGAGNPIEGTGAHCANGVTSGATAVAATPVNAKWYYDLMSSWQAAGQLAASNGPLTVFYFEATDEVWKGLDDGWGLWSSAVPGGTRTPNYALCGVAGIAGAPVCTNPVYAGAGY